MNRQMEPNERYKRLRLRPFRRLGRRIDFFFIASDL